MHTKYNYRSNSAQIMSRRIEYLPRHQPQQCLEWRIIPSTLYAGLLCNNDSRQNYKVEISRCGRLTMRSKRSLRSLGPAKAGPLA
jgi:hypothetical protein